MRGSAESRGRVGPWPCVGLPNAADYRSLRWARMSWFSSRGDSTLAKCAAGATISGRAAGIAVAICRPCSGGVAELTTCAYRTAAAAVAVSVDSNGLRKSAMASWMSAARGIAPDSENAVWKRPSKRRHTVGTPAADNARA